MEAKENKDEKPKAMDKLAEVIQEAVQDVISEMESPGIRDEEMVRDAISMMAIRKRIRRIGKEIKSNTPQIVKDLEKERKELKEELNETAITLEVRIAGDQQLLLDEIDDDDDDDD